MVLDAIQLRLVRCIPRWAKHGFTVMLAYGRIVNIALHLVLATVQGAKDSWAVITDEPPTLQTLWQYALR